MARKKNLSDLLREEIGNSPEAAASPPPAPAASKTASPDPPASAPAPAASSSKSLSRMTKAELQSHITHLNESLETHQADLSRLQGTIVELETTLAQQAQTQQAQTQQAQQTALEQTQRLKADLDQTKTDALNLAKENKRLHSQNQQLTQANADLTSQLQTQATQLASPQPNPRATRTPSPQPNPRATRTPAPRTQAPRTPSPRRTPTPRTPTPRTRTPSLPPSRSILERPIRPSPIINQTGQKSKNFDTWCYD